MNWGRNQANRAHNWWTAKPDCRCREDAANFLNNWGGPLALQGAWGLYSSPAGKEGLSYSQRWGKIGKWSAHIPRQIRLPNWRSGTSGRSLPIPLIGGRTLSVPTFTPGWHLTSPDVFGPIPTRRFLPQNARTEYTGLRTRNIIKSVTGTRWNFSGVGVALNPWKQEILDGI